jgi:hypothetical protein
MRSETDRQKYRLAEIKRGRNILLSENEARKWEQKNRNYSLVKKVEKEKKRKRINCQTQKRRFRFIRKDIFSIWMFHKKTLKRSFLPNFF